MDDNVFPSVAGDSGVVNGLADLWRKVLPAHTSRSGRLDEVFLCFGAGFLNNDRVIIVLFAKEEPVSLLFGGWCR